MHASIYKSLAIGPGEIRLLYLSPGLGEEALSGELRTVWRIDRPLYEALSYVWGANDEKIDITVNKNVFPVTPNLASALRHLRHPLEKRALWIDQICINQDNNSEKSEQVRAMAWIYKNASKVLVWLGWETISLSNPHIRLDFTDMEWILVRQLIDTFADDRHLDCWRCFSRSDEGTLTTSKDFFSAFNALDRFMRMPWWTRIWTVQEICLARRAEIFVGHHSASWEDFELAAWNVRNHRVGCCMKLFGVLQYDFRRAIDHFYQPIWDIWKQRTPRTLYGGYCDSILTFQEFRHRESKDPRDKIYGVLGLQNLLHIAPNYDQHFSQVYMDLTLQFINISLNLLVLVGDNNHAHFRHLDLPSWTVDWRQSSMAAHRYRYRFYQYRSFCASNRTTASPQLLNGSSLKLRGHRIDAIASIAYSDTFEKGSDVYHPLQQFSLSHRSSFPPKDIYPLGGTNEDAFWRTMINDRVIDQEGIRPVTKGEEAHFHTFSSAFRAWSSEDAYHRVATACEASLHSRSFFSTQKGYIGTGPITAKVGDEVWVLFGGNVPFVVRRASSSSGRDGSANAEELTCELIGDCYVHGIMNGEAMHWPNQPVSSVILS
jgi:hypothetical protein